MKTIPLMIAASLLVASVSATAQSIYEIDSQNTFVKGIEAAEADAYQFGVNKLAPHKTYSSSKLGFELIENARYTDKNIPHLNKSSYMTLEERVWSM